MYRLQDSCLQYLVIFLFEWLFDMYWHWLAGSLLGDNAWIYKYMVWWIRKHPTPSNTSGYTCWIWSLLVMILGMATSQMDDRHTFLDTCKASWQIVFFVWSALLVIRLALGGRLSNLVHVLLGCWVT